MLTAVVRLRKFAGVFAATLTAAAASPVDARAQPPTQPQPKPQPQPQPQETTTLVFMVDVNEDLHTARQILDALRLELVELSATVVKEPVFLANGELSLRVKRAQLLAAKHRATAVLWVDGQENGDLVLYIFDPRRAAPIRRTVTLSPDPGGSESQIDAVAMISRASVTALLEGQELVSEPEPPPEPPPQRIDPTPPPRHVPRPRRIEPEPRKHGYARVSTSYAGNSYAPSVPWQSGVHLALSWQSMWGLYAGAGYLATGAIGAEHNLEGAQFVTGLIRRHPIDLHIGYQHLWGKIGLEAELAVVLDPVTKEFTVFCDDDVAIADECETTSASNSFRITLETVNNSYGIAPRLRFVGKPAESLVLHAGAGVDVFTQLNHELVCDEGTACYPLRATLLAPRQLRFVFVVGFQFLI